MLTHTYTHKHTHKHTHTHTQTHAQYKHTYTGTNSRTNIQHLTFLKKSCKPPLHLELSERCYQLSLWRGRMRYEREEENGRMMQNPKMTSASTLMAASIWCMSTVNVSSEKSLMRLWYEWYHARATISFTNVKCHWNETIECHWSDFVLPISLGSKKAVYCVYSLIVIEVLHGSLFSLLKVLSLRQIHSRLVQYKRSFVEMIQLCT